ncbi:guanine deaminase [Arcobacteraceae bacterium]|nr:guanine deaminase [Arcobacteraceae bacterium]
MKKNFKILQADILYFKDDPYLNKNVNNYLHFYKDGLLVIEDGYIKDIGDYKDLITKYEHVTINNEYINKLILPGFIDTHVHYAQIEMIASYGEQLLPWLEKYTFPTESKFKNKEYAKKISSFFIDELLKNGTTTAMVMGTVHKESVDAIFQSANEKDMRIIAGKVMMDRNAPVELLDTYESSYIQSEELIQKWHEKDRLHYAITPRFAPTSTPKQLEMAGKLKKKYPTTYIQTHLSENKDEIEWVKSLFPKSENYLDVYDNYGLVGDKSVFAHAIHLEEEEYHLLHKKGASVSFCPTSNFFLGSGLFKIREMKKKTRNILIGLGTDIGAGTSLSMIKTLSEAYKVTSLEQNTTTKREPLGAFEAFYQATLGGAKSLALDDKIGKLEKGYEADFIIIDFEVDDLHKLKMDTIENSKDTIFEKLENKLFSLMMMGDDRNIISTFVKGKQVYKK